MPEPSLIFNPKCHFKVQISHGLGSFFQIELFKLAVDYRFVSGLLMMTHALRHCCTRLRAEVCGELQGGLVLPSRVDFKSCDFMPYHAISHRFMSCGVISCACQPYHDVLYSLCHGMHDMLYVIRHAPYVMSVICHISCCKLQLQTSLKNMFLVGLGKYPDVFKTAQSNV